MYCIQICKTKRLETIISLKIGPKHKRERSAKIKINQVTKKDSKIHYNRYFIKLQKPCMNKMLEKID